MSGSTVGGVIGGVVGFYFGGPAGAQAGYMIGSGIGGYVDPEQVQGPRMTDAQAQFSNEGVPRAIIYGTCAVAGNLIQWGPLVEHAVTERQSKGGPELTTFRYTRTVAIRICEAAPLGGSMKLRRVWMDDKLIADWSEANTIPADTAKFESILTFYSGDEDQLPDPSLEALPAAFGGGVGNVPAYRGSCYAVLTDLDCTDRQGAVPQFRWEVVSDGTSVTTDAGIPSLNPDDPDILFWWPLDDAVRNGTAMEIVNGYDGTYSDTDGLESGPSLRAGSSGSLRMQAKDNYMLADLGMITGAQSKCSFVGRAEWTLACYAMLEDEDIGGSVMRVATMNWSAPQFGEHAWGIVFPEAGDVNTPYGSYDYGAGPGGGTVTIVSPREYYPVPVRLVMTYGGGVLSLYASGSLVKSQAVTFAPTNSGRYVTAGGGGGFPNSTGFIGCVSDIQGWKRCFTSEEVANDSLLLSETFSAPDASGTYVKTDGTVLVLTQTTVTPGMVALDAIVQDLADRAGIDSSQIDVSALSGIEVRGYPVARQTTADAAIRELQKVFFFDFPEWGNSGDTGTKLRAVLRGGLSVLTLTDDDMVDNDEDEDIRPQQVEFPRKLSVTVADPEANYEPVTEAAERDTENVKAVGEQQVSTAVVLVRSECAELADKLLKTAWEAATGRINREVPDEFSQYTPSDCLDYGGKRYRIERVERRDGSSLWEMVRDRASAAMSNASGSESLPPSSPVSSIRGPTLFQVMNLPSLRSADNVPGVYVAAQGLLDGWIGADIYLSVDGGATEQKVATIVNPATMGELAEDIDEDGTSSSGGFSVQMYLGGELESVTQDQLDARQNGFALITAGVADVGQFQYADETSTPRLYDLSNVERGQLGTTAAAHNSGDRFVLLDGAVLFVPIDAQFASQTLIFRAVSIGTAPANNPTTSIVFDPPTFIVDGGEVTP